MTVYMTIITFVPMSFLAVVPASLPMSCMSFLFSFPLNIPSKVLYPPASRQPARTMAPVPEDLRGTR